jgi:hypothetical protein
MVLLDGGCSTVLLDGGCSTVLRDGVLVGPT